MPLNIPPLWQCENKDFLSFMHDKKKGCCYNRLSHIPREETGISKNKDNSLSYMKAEIIMQEREGVHQNVMSDRTDAFHHMVHSFWLQFCSCCYVSSSPLRKSKSHNPRTEEAINKVWNESADVRSYKVAEKEIYLLCICFFYIS